MRNTLSILIALVCCISVSAQTTPEKTTLYFQKNATITTKSYDDSPVVEVNIVPGKNLVFFYEWQSRKNPMVADADRTDKLYFELTPTQAKSFQASGDELAKVSTIRCRLCFCLEGGCRNNPKGMLTVKKSSCGKYAVTYKDEADSERYLVDAVFSAKKEK